MQVDQSILNEITVQLDEIDFSGELAKIADLTATAEVAAAAFDKARARHAEILQQLRSFDGRTSAIASMTNGAAVAAALMAGESASDATLKSVTELDLERERDAIMAALPHLRQRIDGAHRAIDETRRSAHQRTAGIVEPLAATLHEQVKNAATTIVDCWAALDALSIVTNQTPNGLRAARTAIAGTFLDDGSPFDRSTARSREVPLAVREALAPLERTDTILRFQVPTTRDVFSTLQG